MNHYWLSCEVAPGMFPNEYAISGTESDGNSFELFVPEERRGQFVKAPLSGEGPGQVLVELVEITGPNARIRLPQHRLVGGPFVTVRRSDLVPATPPNVPQHT